jgi:hypothetical protein
MRRDDDLEAAVVGKYAVIAPALNERARRLWAAAESNAIGYGGDALVSAATGMSRDTIRKGRRGIEQGVTASERIRRAGAGRPSLTKTQPGLESALESLVDPVTRGDPMSPLRWTCRSRARRAASLTEDGWQVSSTTVGCLLNGLGYRLQPVRRDSGGGLASRSQRPVRVHQRHRGQLPAAKAARHLSRHQEEGTRRRFQEWRKRVAPQGHAREGPGAPRKTVRVFTPAKSLGCDPHRRKRSCPGS